MAVRTKLSFQRGNEVEICSKEEGFVGSYYSATVVANMGTNYVVQYENLVENELSDKPLKETVMPKEVRPRPPDQIRASGFRYGDRVDAFDNDGWWVGTVTGKRGSSYFVFFETTWDEIAYPVNRLRVHLNWRHGNWVARNKREKVRSSNVINSSFE